MGCYTAEAKWIHIYVWLTPFAVHLKLTQYCLSAIPQYEVRSLKLNKKTGKENSQKKKREKEPPPPKANK